MEVFKSTSKETPLSIEVKEEINSTFSFQNEDISSSKKGDGTVPDISASIPNFNIEMVENKKGKHTDLIKEYAVEAVEFVTK